jgi:hypothetical protein
MKKFFVLLAALGMLLGVDNACLGEIATFTNTPAAVSNTYSGYITLQIGGLTNGEKVVVQEFLDANTNGIIDAGDFLVQQFNLTDGQASVFHDGTTAVTNFNVPGDTDSTAGQITAQLGFSQLGGVVIIGKYALRLSSPTGHFTPITNFFSITNFPYAGSFTGNVVSNGTSTTLPNAVVLLSQPSGDGGQNVSSGVVANNSGGYAIKAPPGNYALFAFKSNFVANLGTAPSLALSSGTITTNLSLIPATRSISGKIIDASTRAGLPGISGVVSSTDNFLAVFFTDTNGNFTVPVTASQWKFEGNSPAGYLESQNSQKVDTTTGSVLGVTNALTKATAVFYGSVKDSNNNPLVGVNIYSSDNNGGTGQYQQDSSTDANTNYNYVAGALGGDIWYVQVDNNQSPSLANYIFSQSQNNSINLTNGQAVRQDFTAILATNQITGNVKFNGTNVVGVQVYAYATIGTNNYQAQMDTDANGNYSLNVANGNWNVNVYDCNGCGDNDSLSTVLNGQNYEDPASQNATINNNIATNNFTIQYCGGVQIITTSPLPDGTNGDYYVIQLQGSDCNNNFIWSLDDPSDFPSSLTFNSDGEIFGTPDTTGTYNFSVNVNDGNGHSANTNLSLTIVGAASPLQITTSSLPNGTNTEFYSQTLQASGGTPPYGWYVPDYSASPPANLSLSTGGVLSGTLSTTAQSYSFYVDVTDSVSTVVEELFTLNVVTPPALPLTITNALLPNGSIGVPYSAQLGATGGQPPYFWSYALGSQNLSAIGLSLNSSGLISGTPTTNRVFSFKAQVTDSNVSDPPTNKVLSITINSKPVLVSQSWQTNRFQMRLTGASNQNYTLQLSTNLSSTNWIPLFITNSATTNSFLLTDPNATNKQRFYRVLIGP